MSEEESRYVANSDVEQAYAVTVEQVVVDLIESTGVQDGTQEQVMQNLKAAGWTIVRNVVKMFEHEIIILGKDGQIEKVGQVFVDGDEVKHIIMTADEFEKAANKKGEKNNVLKKS